MMDLSAYANRAFEKIENVCQLPGHSDNQFVNNLRDRISPTGLRTG